MKKRFFALGLSVLLLVACSSTDTAQESPVVVEPAKSSTQETAASSAPTIIDRTQDPSRSSTLDSIIDVTKLVDASGEAYQVPADLKDYVGKYQGTFASEEKEDGLHKWVGKGHRVIYSDGRYESISIYYSPKGKSNTAYLDDNNVQQYSSSVGVEYDGATYYPSVSSSASAYVIHYTQGLVVERFGELYWLPLMTVRTQDFFISSDGQANYSRALKSELEEGLGEFSLQARYAENLANSDVGAAVSLDDYDRVNEFEPAVEKFLTNYDEEKDSEESNPLNRLFQYSFKREDYQDREIAIEPLTEELSKAAYDKTGKPVDIKRGYLLKVDGDYKEGVVLTADGWTRFNYDGGDKIILK